LWSASSLPLLRDRTRSIDECRFELVAFRRSYYTQLVVPLETYKYQLALSTSDFTLRHYHYHHHHHHHGSSSARHLHISPPAGHPRPQSRLGTPHPSASVDCPSEACPSASECGPGFQCLALGLLRQTHRALPDVGRIRHRMRPPAPLVPCLHRLFRPMRRTW